MFKIARVTNSSRQEAEAIMQRIYDEAPQHWPHGVSADHFDGGLFLVREKSSSVPVGFVGWQERWDNDLSRIGYYSVGILPEYRQNGFAKEALAKLIAIKSAGVDKVRAMVVSTNRPSLELAKSLGVETRIKKASQALSFTLLVRQSRLPFLVGAMQ